MVARLPARRAVGEPWAERGTPAAGAPLDRAHPLRLHALERCCGPEPEMEYQVDAEGWRRKVTSMTRGLTDPIGLPPPIVEWKSGRLSVRDCSHRLVAASLAGWPALWAVMWYDDPAVGDTVRKAVATATCRAAGGGGTASAGTTCPCGRQQREGGCRITPRTRDGRCRCGSVGSRSAPDQSPSAPPPGPAPALAPHRVGVRARLQNLLSGSARVPCRYVTRQQPSPPRIRMEPRTPGTSWT